MVAEEVDAEEVDVEVEDREMLLMGRPVGELVVEVAE